MSKSRDIADSAATINYIDNVTSDVQSQINTLDTALDNISVTSGTLTKTFASGESASISLTSSVLAPVVSVTKEVPQSGVTNNSWDVNSTTENYTRLDSAYDTTLDFVGFDISTASFVDSFSVAGQDTSPESIAFNNDGTKMFVLGGTNDSVYEYTLSTGFDASTASFVDSFSVSGQEAAPLGLQFNTDGTKMFVCGYSGKEVNEYVLSAGFDISTATYSQNFSVSSEAFFPRGLSFNINGTKMYIADATTSTVYQYTLSTSFDVSTASYDSINFSVSAQETGVEDIAFNSDGTKMFIIGKTGDDVNEYTLSTAFDVSTASFNQLFSVQTEDIEPNGIAFNSDGSKMFIIGGDGSDVNEYTLPLSLTLGTGSFASADVGKTIEANSGVFVLTATDGSYVETTAPTSYDQVASGSWEMYGVVYNASSGDLELSAYEGEINLGSASYDSVSFSVATESSTQYGLAFSTDGTKMFVLDSGNDSVDQYTLSTPFVVSSASYDSVSFSVTAQESSPLVLSFNKNGTKMYIGGSTTDSIHQYSLTTAWDVSSASYDYISLYTGSRDTSIRDMCWNNDGSKMYIVGTTLDSIFQYTLSSSYDLSTAIDDNKTFSFVAQESSPNSIVINDKGTKLFILGTGSDTVFEYTFDTPFDVTTLSYSGVSFSIAAQETTPWSLVFNNDFTKMYVLGAANDTVYQYSVPKGASYFPTGYHPVHTTASTDTRYWTDINSMTADQNAGDGNVYYAISTDDRTTWTVIDNTDGERDIVRNNAGTWQYNSNGTYASETWVNGTTNTELATLAEAMEGAVGSGVVNPFDVSTAVYSQNFSVAAQELTPQGIAFNTDGTKMFIIGEQGKDVNEYALSTAFDVSTASYTRAFPVSSYATFPAGIAFNTDGTKMFIVGWQQQEVNQFTLSTGFNVSTATYATMFSVASQDSSPQDIAFNSDGSKMFIVGATNDAVYEYTLSTNFNVSTASFVDSFSVADTQANGLTFNTDGSKMFVVGATSDLVYEYTLSTGFDISTASYAQSFSVLNEDGYSGALTFNTDGSKLFVVGLINDKVNEYNIGNLVYTNQMDKTQLDAVTDPNHIALGNDLDLAIVFNMTSGSTVPSSDGVAINYDANVLNKGAVLGTDYDFDAPTQNSVRITALAANNLKVRVV